MLRRFTGACGLVLCMAALAGGQTIEERVAKLEGDVTKVERDVADLSKNVSEVSRLVTEQLGVQQQILEKLQESTNQLNEQYATQQQILSAISTSDSSTGQPIPRLSANMEASEDFKRDVYDAVHKSIQKEGEFSITNNLSTYQRIYVNRHEYGIRPGERVTLRVPVGTVTTQLPGDSVKNWTLSTPGYEESIEIVPRQPTVVYSPPVYSEPVYYYGSTYYNGWWLP